MSEPTPNPLEPQPILIVVGEDTNNSKVYRGEALVYTNTIYIDSIDEKGKAWLMNWWEYGPIASEVTIKCPTTTRTEPIKKTLFKGFLSFSYFNQRDTPDKTQKGIERFVAALRVLQPFKGTPLHRNWRECKANGLIWACEEWFLYSDRRFSGEIVDFGPYDIENTGAADEPVMGALVFRAKIHQKMSGYDPYVPLGLDRGHRSYLEYRERIVESWSGELAAVLSVATGTRLIGGQSIRTFTPGLDIPIGRPHYPGAPPHMHAVRQSILPYYSKDQPESLEPARDILAKYLELNTHDAVTFLRSARLYQKALLRCDEEPDLAWVWCVSAIEALAEDPGSVDKPSLKFVNFLDRFLPAPPPIRPPHFQVDWANLRPSFEQIYNYRSQFLHAGFPFPTPMTRRPQDESRGEGQYGERPHGGLGFGDTMFESSASPMHFHVFLHVVRWAMLKWLRHTYEGTRGVPEPAGDDAAREDAEGDDTQRK